MTSTRLLSTFLISTLLVPGAALAEFAFNDYYVGANIGYIGDADATGGVESVDARINFDPDGEYSVGLLAGARVYQQLRVEGELSFQSTDVDGPKVTISGGTVVAETGGDLDATSLLFSAWYDIPTSGRFVPYVGGGIGFTRVEGDFKGTGSNIGNNGKDDDTGFTYQVGFGVLIPVSESGSIDIGYRFRETRDLTLQLGTGAGATFDSIDFETHTLQVGYSYRF